MSRLAIRVDMRPSTASLASMSHQTLACVAVYLYAQRQRRGGAYGLTFRKGIVEGEQGRKSDGYGTVVYGDFLTAAIERLICLHGRQSCAAATVTGMDKYGRLMFVFSVLAMLRFAMICLVLLLW